MVIYEFITLIDANSQPLDGGAYILIRHRIRPIVIRHIESSSLYFDHNKVDS